MTTFSTITRHRRRGIASAVACALLVSCGVSGGKGGAELSAGAPTGAAQVGPGVGEQVESSTSSAATHGSTGVETLVEVARATAKIDTMQMAMSVTLTGMEGGETVLVSLDGAVDVQGGRSHFTADVGDLFGSIGTGSGTVEVIVDGSTIYLRADQLGAAADGKPWVSISLDELAGGEAFGGGLVPGTTDPAQMLEFLEDAGIEVTEVGREEVRGVPTTHLRADIDLESLLSSLAPAEFGDRLDLGGSLPSLPVDLWVGDDQIIRRIRVNVDLGAMVGSAVEEGFPAPEGLDQAGVVIDLELFDIGQPVDITAPDPSQVAELADGLLGGGILDGGALEGLIPGEVHES